MVEDARVPSNVPYDSEANEPTVETKAPDLFSILNFSRRIAVSHLGAFSMAEKIFSKSLISRSRPRRFSRN